LKRPGGRRVGDPDNSIGDPEDARRRTPEERYRRTVGSGAGRISASSFGGDVPFEISGG